MTGMNRHTCHVSLNSVSQTFLYTNNLTHSAQQQKRKCINKQINCEKKKILKLVLMQTIIINVIPKCNILAHAVKHLSVLREMGNNCAVM